VTVPVTIRDFVNGITSVQNYNLMDLPDSPTPVNEFVTLPDGSYTYDTLQFAFNKRFGSGLFIQSSYDYQWRDELRRADSISGSPLNSDPLAVGFAVVVALVSSAIFGAAPALRVSRPDVQSRLRDGGRGSTGGVRDRVRAGLIVGEVALSVLLLFGAGLLIRSAIALQRTDPGFNPRGVLSARLTLPATAYTEPARIVSTLNQIVDAAGKIPGATSVAMTSYAAMGGGGGTNLPCADRRNACSSMRFASL
jgi:hypothetical protein